MPHHRLRVITHGPASPAYNMAVDESLLLHIQDPVLRIYQWDCPAVSIGYFQPAAIVPAGRPFVRRYTGGGLVDHACDLTYTLVLPREHPIAQAGTSASYCAIHRAISVALHDAGIPNALTPVALEGDPSACFAKPVAHDIIHPPTGRKLAGAAQRRNRHGVLHQGSILHPEPGVRPPECLVEKIITEVSRTIRAEQICDDLTPAEADTARNLEAGRYCQMSWNFQK